MTSFSDLTPPDDLELFALEVVDRFREGRGEASSANDPLLQETSVLLRSKLLQTLHEDPRIAVAAGPDAVSRARARARELLSGGNRVAGRELQESLVREAESQLGATDLNTLEVKTDLGFTLYQEAEFGAAQELQLEILYSYIELHGGTDEHQDVLEAMLALADTILRIGREPDRAIALLQHVYEVRSKILGARHSDTLAVMEQLRMVKESQQPITPGDEPLFDWRWGPDGFGHSH